MKFKLDQAKKMVEMILKTQEVELSCDEVHEILDHYTEMALAGKDIAKLLPSVHHHLHMCPDCIEEYEALKRILNKQAE
jgi:transcriptional regulator CtsR